MIKNQVYCFLRHSVSARLLKYLLTCLPIRPNHSFEHYSNVRERRLLCYVWLSIQIMFPCFPVPRFPPLQNWSSVFQSCDFHPCDLVPRFPVPRFPPLRFGPTFSSPAFSSPAFSASPFQVEHTVDQSRNKYRYRLEFLMPRYTCTIHSKP